jgi:hypothetical protein
MAKLDWINLKKDYILGDYKSLNSFAESKGLNRNGNFNKQTKGWSEEKATKGKEKSNRIVEKTIEKVANKEASRNARILDIADKLAAKVEESVNQLERFIVKNKTKTKTVKYNYKVGKPSEEVIEENETIEILDGIIDRQGLKFLTAALRDIKELQPKEEVELPELPDDGFIDAMKADAKSIWADEGATDD